MPSIAPVPIKPDTQPVPQRNNVYTKQPEIDLRQYISTPNAVSDFMKFARTDYGIATTAADIKKGYSPFTQDSWNKALTQYAYNTQRRSSQGKSALKFGSLDYNPFNYDESDNQDYSDFYTAYKRTPTDGEFATLRGKRAAKLEGIEYDANQKPVSWNWQSYYQYDKNDPNDTARQKLNLRPKSLLAEYQNNPEDDRRKQAGLPPLKVENTLKVIQQLQQYKEMAQRTNTYQTTNKSLLAQFPDLATIQGSFDYRARNAPADVDPMDIKYGTTDPTSQHFNVDILKRFGYDPQKGFDLNFGAAPAKTDFQTMLGDTKVPNIPILNREIQAQAQAAQATPAAAAQAQPQTQPAQTKTPMPDWLRGVAKESQAEQGFDLYSQVGAALSAVASPVRNLAAAVADIWNGKKPGYSMNMSGADFSAHVAKAFNRPDTDVSAALNHLYTSDAAKAALAKATGLPVNNQLIQQVAQLQGQIAQMPYDFATDPSSFLGAGEIAAIARGGKTAKMGTLAYEDALKAGKLTSASGAKAAAELNAMEAQQAAAANAPNPAVERPIAPQDLTVRTPQDPSALNKATAVDNTNAPTMIVPANEAPANATPLSMKNEFDLVDSYKPEEHVQTGVNNAEKLRYYATDANGNIIGKFKTEAKALQATKNYQNAMLDAIGTKKPAPMQVPDSTNVLYVDPNGVIRTVPYEPLRLNPPAPPAPTLNPASDSMGNMLRGSNSAEGVVKNPMPVQIKPYEGAGVSWGNPKRLAELRTPAPKPLKRASDSAKAGVGNTTSKAVQSATGANGAPSAAQAGPAQFGDQLGIVDPHFRETDAAIRGLYRDARNKGIYGQAEIQRADKFRGNPTNGLTFEHLMQMVRNAGSIANHMLSRGLTDRAGNKIGKSLQEIYNKIPAAARSAFKDYQLNLHNIDRMGIEQRATDAVDAFKRNNPMFNTMSQSQIEALAQSQSSPDAQLALDYLDLLDKEHNAKNLPVMPSLNDPNVPRTAAESDQIVKDYNRTHPEFAGYQQDFQEYNDKLMQEYSVGTFTTPEQYAADKDKYKNYVSTRRVDYANSPQGTGGRGGGLQPRNPFRKAKGAITEVVDPYQSEAERTLGVVRAQKKNDLYLSMIDWAKNNPEEAKDFVRYGRDKHTPDMFTQGINGAPITDVADLADKMGVQDMKNGTYRISAYRNGKLVSAFVSKRVYDSLRWLNGDFGDAANTFIKWGGKLQKPLKAATTDFNPYFMGPNAFRDLNTAYIQGEKINPAAFGKDVGQAAIEMAKNSEHWQNFRALGGEYSTFYNQNKGLSGSAKPGIKQVIANGDKKGIVPALGRSTVRTVGETAQKAESLNRFGLYLDGIKRYGDTEVGRIKAIYNAAEGTVNFSKTAPVAKVVDSIVPYFNAAVQGLDKTIMQTLRQPLKTVGKSISSITVATATLYAINHGNPHYQELDNRVKDLNYCIPNYAGPIDAQGYPETFIKFPKDRVYGEAFGAAAERVLRAAGGDKEPFKGMGETMKTQIAPPNPFAANITSAITYNIPANKDFADRPIVPQSLVALSGRNQYDNNTSEMAKWIGQKLNYSPMRIDYLIKNYTGGYGKTVLPMLQSKNATAGDRVYSGVVKPWLNLIVADPTFSNQRIGDFYDALDKATTLAKDVNKEQGIPSGANTPEERRASALNKVALDLADLKKQEQAVADSGLSAQDQEAKVKELRQQAITLAKNAIDATDSGSTTIYPAGVDDTKRDAYDNVRKAGVSESKLKAIFAKFQTLKPQPGNKTVTEKDRKIAAFEMIDSGKITQDDYNNFIRIYYGKQQP